MPKSVISKKRRGAALTKVDEDRFLEWLPKTGSPTQAAIMARVSLGAMKMRRQRNKRFRAAWDAALNGRHLALVETFYAYLEKTGHPKTSYLAAGLTESWYYHKMIRDPAFRARVQEKAGLTGHVLLEKAIEQAKDGDNVLLFRLLERYLGPTTPRGG